MAVAAVSGAMAVALPAHADSTADGSAAGSPGLISGNGVQLPVNLPVNLCGNTVNVVGVLNPAAGNTCANEGAGETSGTHGASSGGGATARGAERGSPGVVSGNGVQLPVHLPVNASGNSVNVVGIGNPAFGNRSVNVSGEQPRTPDEPAPRPPVRHNPPSQAQHPGPRTDPPAPAVRGTVPEAVGALAHTGSDATVPAVAGAALLLGGVALQRRFRPRPQR
ncbi:chaplin [Streptomyces asoensis]|uniref:chaplin n=1 Tax=Streptomyces asoensis TaxID=249586 RepID=UPI0033DE5115